MPLRARAASLFVLLALAAPAKADGPLEFGAAIGTSWYDHTNVPNSYSGKLFRPWVRYEGPAGNWDVRGFAQERLQFYTGRTADSALGGTSRQWNEHIEGTALRTWAEGQDLSFGGRFVHSHDAYDPGLGIALPHGNVFTWSGEAGSHFELYEAGLRARGKNYEADPRLVDARSFGWTARIVPVRRPHDSAFAGITGSQLNVDEAVELITLRPGAGYRRRLDPLLTAEIEAGAALARFADGTDQALPMLALGLMRDPNRGSALGFELRARLEGDSLAAVYAEARYPIASGRMHLRVQSDAEAEGGYYSTANRTTEFTWGALDTLGRANILGIDGSYGITQPLRGEGPTTDLVRTTAYAIRRVQPWLDVRVAASYVHEYARSFRPPVRRVRLEAELDLLASGFASTAFRTLTEARP